MTPGEEVNKGLIDHLFSTVVAEIVIHAIEYYSFCRNLKDPSSTSCKLLEIKGFVCLYVGRV